MYKALNGGDIEELLQSLSYSKKHFDEQKIDPTMPKELRDDQRVRRDEHLATIDKLMTKLRFLRDGMERDDADETVR